MSVQLIPDIPTEYVFEQLAGHACQGNRAIVFQHTPRFLHDCTLLTCGSRTLMYCNPPDQMKTYITYNESNTSRVSTQIISVFEVWSTVISRARSESGSIVGDIVKADELLRVLNNYPQISILWPSDTAWRHRPQFTLAQVMACCRTAPSNYLNKCWIINKGVCFVFVLFSIHMTAISPEVFINSIRNMCSKITLLTTIAITCIPLIHFPFRWWKR